MARLRSLWRNVFRRDRVEQDLDDEMRSTLQLLIAEKVAAGLSETEARRVARLEIGIESVKQQVRDVRGGAFVDTLLRDVRFASRLLWRNPLFTVTAALSLAIGIGATTAIFTVVNGLLLRAATGVVDSSRLVEIARHPVTGPGVEFLSYPHLLELRRRSRTLDDVFGYQLQATPASVTSTDGAATAFVSLTTTNYFHAAGVAPYLGRLFDSGDRDQLSASPIAVLSHRYWQRRFLGDPAVIGRAVRINNVPITIVGVAAEDFKGLSIIAPDVWLPVSMITVISPEGRGMELTNARVPWLMIGARLKPHVSRAQASAEVAGIGAALQRDTPVAVTPEGIQDIDGSALVWSAEITSPVPYGVRVLAATFFGLLMALVAVVLVIACANLAGVLLARATNRRREIAVRTAVGAARARIVRQLLTETVLLFTLGGAAGLVLARLILRALISLLPQFPLPANVSVPLDGRVVTFALVLSFAAAVLAGLAPAFHAARTDVIGALKDDSQGPTDRLRLRNVFVVAQVAFSILLVVIAGLFVRAFDNVVSVNQGFDPRGVQVATLDLTMGGYTEATARDVIRGLRERIGAIPGVASVTIADRAPGVGGGRTFGSLAVPGAPPPRNGRRRFTNWMLVEPGFFATTGIPLKGGRDFTADDGAGGELVGIVSERTARRLWPERDPIGQIVAVTQGSPGDPVLFSLKGSRQVEPHIRIVGVVGDIEIGGQRGDAAPLALYVPLAQKYVPQITIVVRPIADQQSPDIRAAVEAVDRNLPVLTTEPLERENNGPVQTQLRISAMVAGTVGLVGLFLAGIGIYGVTVYAVSQRTREIGIRLSLGAGRGEVIRLVLVQGMRLVTIGSVIGLALGLGAGKLISGRQFGILPADPVVLTGAAVLFMLVGLVACYLPVRRAVRIRATEALRYE